MSVNPGSSAPRVLLLPELLASIGSYLTPPDLLPCVLVCRDWNELFIPLLWQTINDKLYAWPRILKDLTDSSSAPEERVQKEDWIRGLYVKYGHHIRNLDANFIITILSAQATGSCTHLRTLAVVGSVLGQPFQEAQLLREQFRYDVISTEAQARMSKALISPVFEGVFLTALPSLSNEEYLLRWWQQWVFIQRFWLLVLQNPDLVGLRLGKTFSRLRLGLQDEFILRTLASLRNLTKLDTYIWGGGFDFRVILEHLPQVQHFASGFGRLLVPKFDRKFLQIRTIRFCTMLQLSGFFLLLDCLPNLDQLWIQGICRVRGAEGRTVDTRTPTSRLRELHITTEYLSVLEETDSLLANQVLPRLPDLTALSIRALYPLTAAALGTHCPELQSFRLVDYEHSIHPDESEWLEDNVVGLLLRRCPNLKILDAINHELYADYLLAEPWVCQGLETFRCQIIGMGRLEFREQDIYNAWEAATDRDDKKNKGNSVEEQVDARVMEIVEKQRRSHELHGQVYSRLGEMRQLKVLDLGYEFRIGSEALFLSIGQAEIMQVDGRLYTDLSLPICNSLELTLVSGLDRLGTLKDLEVFGFEGVNHRIGTKELAWMATSWPRLKIMRGFQEPPPILKHGDDVKVQMLKSYMEELRPDVKHEAIEEVHEMSRHHNRFWYTF